MTTISAIHTSCKNCVFAKYDENTQTNCSLDFINKLQQNNVEIIEAYDNEKEFYIINNKKCIGYRENKWFEQFGLADACLDDKITKFTETNRLHYTVIISLRGFENPSDLKTLCSNLTDNTVGPPQKIIFLRRKSQSLIYTFDMMNSLIDECNISCGWRIQSILDEDVTDESIINSVLYKDTKSRFVVQISGPVSNLNPIIKTNEIVHKDMGQIMVVSDKNKTCIVYSASVYRYVGKIENTNLLNDDTKYMFV